MIHRVSQKKLSRDTGARRALLKNLAADLILHEKIVTTKVRAKALRPVVEKLITRAKKDSLANRRYLVARLKRENEVRKLLELIGPTFKERPGGYLRISKLPARAGDNTEMAAVEFVERVSEMAARKKLEEKAKEEKPKKSVLSPKQELPAKKARVGRKTSKDSKLVTKKPTTKK